MRRTSIDGGQVRGTFCLVICSTRHCLPLGVYDAKSDFGVSARWKVPSSWLLVE